MSCIVLCPQDYIRASLLQTSPLHSPPTFLAYIISPPSPPPYLSLTTQQCKMQAHDRLEADKAIVRNAVEEYVYDMRDKLSEELMEFISEEVRTVLGGGLTR